MHKRIFEAGLASRRDGCGDLLTVIDLGSVDGLRVCQYFCHLDCTDNGVHAVGDGVEEALDEEA